MRTHRYNIVSPFSSLSTVSIFRACGVCVALFSLALLAACVVGDPVADNATKPVYQQRVHHAPGEWIPTWTVAGPFDALPNRAKLRAAEEAGDDLDELETPLGNDYLAALGGEESFAAGPSILRLRSMLEGDVSFEASEDDSMEEILVPIEEPDLLVASEVVEDPVIAESDNAPLPVILSAAPGAGGFLDLNKAFREAGIEPGETGEFGDVAAYAWTTLICPEAGMALLRAGSDDGLVIWINGEEILRRGVYRAAAPDQELQRVPLRRGLNNIVVKVDQGMGGWGFYLKLDAVRPEIEGPSVFALEPVVAPVVIVGAALPVTQLMNARVMAEGTAPSHGVRFRLRAPFLETSTTQPMDLEVGEVADIALPIASTWKLQPGEEIELELDAIYPDGRVVSLKKTTTTTALAHELLRPLKTEESGEGLAISSEGVDATPLKDQKDDVKILGTLNDTSVPEVGTGVQLPGEKGYAIESVPPPVSSAGAMDARDSDVMTIVQISDPHIARRDSVLSGAKTAERLEQAVAEVNAMDPAPEFVVVTGDFTHDLLDAYPLYKEIMDGLDVPYLTIFGNHDKVGGVAESERALSEWGLPSFYSIVRGDVNFVFLDTMPSNVSSDQGRIGRAQRDWLRRILQAVPAANADAGNQNDSGAAEGGATRRIFFGHHDQASGRSSTPESIEALQAIVAHDTAEQWFFAGHWHSDVFLRIGDQRHIITTTTGYYNTTNDLPHHRIMPGYRLIHIMDDAIVTEFKPLGAAPLPDPNFDEYLEVEELEAILAKYDE